MGKKRNQAMPDAAKQLRNWVFLEAAGLLVWASFGPVVLVRWYPKKRAPPDWPVGEYL